MHLEWNLLEVEDDVGGVLDDARNRRELVEHAIDLHGSDRGALDRGKQHSAQCVTDSRAEAALERLRVESPEPIGQGLSLEIEPLRTLKAFPQHCVLPFANGPAVPASRPASLSAGLPPQV